jgi:hypothetical protein
MSGESASVIDSSYINKDILCSRKNDADNISEEVLTVMMERLQLT